MKSLTSLTAGDKRLSSETSGLRVVQVAASGTAMRTSVREPTRSPQDALPCDRLPLTSQLRSQQGAALLIMFMVLIIAGLTVLLKGLSAPDLEQALKKTTINALAQGKELAISFAVANPTAPGGMPYPDRRQDNNYDGNGDCVTGGFNPTLHLIGQWPSLLEQGCGPDISAFGRPLQDGTGANLWYAVSRNLVKSAGGNYPLINSEILDLTTGWFTVVNEQGTVLTQRAAVVILAPGLALAGQNRGGAAPTANQFLEAATVNGVVYTNFAIEANDTGFILQPPNNAFNDHLVYITIDELMAAVENRVVKEFAALLRNYRTSCGQYPWPVPYGNPRTMAAFNSVANTLEGLLPTGAALPTVWGTGCAAGLSVPAWMTTHGWQRLSYYALASAAVQGGGVCTAGVDCLTAAGLPNPNNDKRAIALLAGEELAGQNRASFTGLTDYFDDTNNSPLDRLFTTQGTAPFNDRLEVIQ